MCGRYATTRSAAELSALFEASDETDGLAADYNVAPTDPVPIVRVSRRQEQPVLSVARWGLVPSWAKDTKGAARMINARAETVETTRAFATSFASRRCLVPADGWYEWVRRRPGTAALFHDPAGRRGAGVRRPLGVVGRRRRASAHLHGADHGGGGRVGARPRPDAAGVAAASGGVLAAVAATTADLLAAPTEAEFEAIEVRPVAAAVGDVRNDGPH